MATSSSWSAASIYEVWADNLEAAFDELEKSLDGYSYIAVDTEFPGVLVRPILSYRDTYQYRYYTTKANVDMLKIIQIGITLLDSSGRPRDGISTWSFNFKFDLNTNMHAPDSIQLLTKAGLNFADHKRKGIEPEHFGELLMTSGLVLTDKVSWICFHGAYDFAYILRLLTGKDKLPDNEKTFFEMLSIYFPKIVDIKYLMTLHKDLSKGGLDSLGEELHLRRIGTQHTAGSDSRLTGDCFFILKSNYFEDNLDVDTHFNHIYGLGSLSRLTNGVNS